MTDRIRITRRGDTAITVAPAAYLGNSFNRYLAATREAGCRFDPATRTQYAPLAQAAHVVAVMARAGFALDVAPEIQAGLQAQAASAKDARGEAVERRTAVEAEMAERGLALFPFQRVGVEWLASRKGALLADEMGCVDGDAVVHANRAGRGFRISLRNLYLMHGGKVGRWDLSIPTTVRSLCGDELHQHRIAKVLARGEREVVRVILKSGRSIRLTPDHEVKTPNGWAQAGALVPGQIVLANGEWVDKDGYVRVGGLKGKHPRWTTGGVYRHILVMEKKIGRHVREDEVVHHKNGNPRDNRIENLELLPSSSVHMTKHGREGGYAHMNGGTSGRGGEVWFVPVEDEVVSVEPAGTTDVYDVVCEDPHRNFVANGIIVHNCGKTIQALVAAPAGSPILVIGPVVAKGVWVREAAKWRPDLKPVVVGSYPKRLAKKQGLTVLPRDEFRWPVQGEMLCVNYDILPASPPADCPEGLVVVVDEAHAIKSHKAARTQKTRAIIAAAFAAHGTAWLVTGSPMLNQPIELYSLLAAVGCEKEAFGTWKRFIDLFCGHQDKWGSWSWGRMAHEAIPALQRVMLRRLQADVLSDIPPIRYESESVEIDRETRDLCDELLAQMRAAGVDLDNAVSEAAMGGGVFFVTMSRVRAALATAKIPALVEAVEEYEENEQPVVVFSAHRAPIDTLAKRPGWKVITGDTPADQRTEIERAFQAGELKGVGATIRAGGVSITLTRAHHLVMVDLDWTPELNRQAEFRVQRIGQANAVLVRRLVADHEMDERVTEILAAKTSLVNASVNAAAVRTAPVAVESAAERAVEALDAAMKDRNAAAAVQAVREVVRAAEADGVTIGEGFRARLDLLEASAKPQEPPQGSRRPAASPMERWAARGLLLLSSRDGDRAREDNDIGFNGRDTEFGNSLADQLSRTGGLTDKQWAAAVKVCRTYKNTQIGLPPVEGAA